jgi:NTE family protein
MPAGTNSISIEDFTQQSEVIECLRQLEARYGKGGENLIVSEVVDSDGHQYVNLVQKGGGVLGVALVGYTYILEQMNIRFIRLAGTSAGAINTALMAVGGAKLTPGSDRKVSGNKKIEKSKGILKAICDLNFFDLVDGHPVAKFIIKQFITSADFSKQVEHWINRIVLFLVLLPVLDLVCLGLQYKVQWVSYFTEAFFIITCFYAALLIAFAAYLYYLLNRLKIAGFGINPGDYFYDWIKERLIENHVNSVSDLIDVASTPVPGLHLRGQPDNELTDLGGDVTFIASEIVSENKIEFPRMWNLFTKDMNKLQPAGFVRASMSIPLFFESYFINNIPCKDNDIKAAWQMLNEEDPPSTARFVDGGILSNFPLNLFFNPNVSEPRLPTFGIDLDDQKEAKEVFGKLNKESQALDEDKSKRAETWSFGAYLYRIFNTVRFYYDKDFLIKNNFFKSGIGVIPLKGYNWLNFFLTDKEKQQMFVLGAKAATKFLLEDFNWSNYKQDGAKLRQNLKS